MTALRNAWLGLREPTLQRRSVLFVLTAFIIVWGVLLAYVYVQREKTLAAEPPLQKFGDAVLLSLQDLRDPAQATAALQSTERWVNIRRREIGRLPGQIRFELLDLQGRRIAGAPLLQQVPLEQPTAAPRKLQVEGQPHWLYHAAGPQWALRIAEPVRSTESFLAYNSVFLLEYLLLALPFVLVPAWLSVRTGLKPLQQFAQGIARRRPEDLSPVGIPVRHRELKPLVGALDQLLDKLRHRLDRERSFVQDAAHELRTPLAVVVTQAHVMAHAQDAAERGRAHQLLEQAIARASHLARQLLMLATLDSGQAAGARRVDVAQAVRELLAQAAPQAMARRIELSLEAPDTLPSPVDEAAFASIVLNLVDNAIRYGREGGAIVVTLRGDDERLCLHVQDDGPGIPAQEHALVFERFYRCAGEQQATGSGLGLAIVRQAALRMGGLVQITPGLQGRGIGFLVSLPVPGFRPA